VIDGFRIIRCAEPGGETYIAQFTSELRELSCPLHKFLPRTSIVAGAENDAILSQVAATA
jgi:hypothetical protein